MATGACGIDCDVCQLNLLGQCSSCGAGRSPLAAAKSAAQTRLFGYPCAILACARLNHIDYCPRDCGTFPCDNFTEFHYPYGQGFLEMQRRRRGLGPPAVDPAGRPIQIADTLWEALGGRNPVEIANFTLTDVDASTGGLRFRFLNREILVDPVARRLMQRHEGRWEPMDAVLLELTVLEYFSSIDRLHPLGREMIGTEDLADARYFTGRSRLKTDALLARFGDSPGGLTAAGYSLGGQSEKMADVAVRLDPFPRIPLYYLLWLGSREFPPRLSILFDRSIERLLSSPAIWSLVTLCTYYLLKAPSP